ncbi:MAG: hypothetical protein ACP5PN_09690 [Steroidobacteraceae bacterium]
MRAAALVALGCLVSTPAFAGVWANLWRTPDQQGEALLAAGRPAQAAARFTSARRKAYADLEAGDYAQAARLLAPYKGPTSEYNRGNALAHLGHLRAALAAYDAALKQAPHDRDIRHNRDLIKRILAHRPPPQSAPKQGSKSRPAQSGRSGGKSEQHPGQSGSPPRGMHGGAEHASGASQAQQSAGKSAQQAKHSGKTAARAGGQHAGQGARPRRTGAQPAARSAASAGTSGAGSQPRSPSQARRDAALAAALARQQGKGPRGSARRGARRAARSLLPKYGGQRTQPPKPMSEKKLALDQWLRQIPNDPAGLLRREFLIQYMLRHPGANR